MIAKLAHSEIDIVAYSACIESAVQKNFYAKYDVLNLLCESWELLVYGDYEYVMPVPIVRKFRLKIVSMPLFAQQLGIFGSDDKPEINQLFCKELIKLYPVQSYAFNQKNALPDTLNNRKNYIIPAQHYDLLYKSFSKGRKAVLKKIQGLVVNVKAPDAATFNFIQRHFKGLKSKRQIQDFVTFLQQYAPKLQFHHVYFQNRLVCVAILVETDLSIGLLALINDDSKKDMNAASFVINEILKTEIECRSLDFMGGNIRGIEVFFKSFGAGLITFPLIQNGRRELLKQLFKVKTAW